MSFKVRVLESRLSGTLENENRHRLERVMRLRPGDDFLITDGKGNEARAELASQGSYRAEAWYSPGREAALPVTLFAAVTKGEKFDWLVEKAVELGVRRIVPVISRHCVVKKASEAKAGRWQKIALSAMLQCGGCLLPEVSEPIDLAAVPAAEGRAALVLYEQTAASPPADFSQWRSASECLLLTGPEGGFAADEIEALVKKGWQTVWLGPRIFRAETAPLLAVSALLTGSWGAAVK